jgi:hypothetical protein
VGAVEVLKKEGLGVMALQDYYKNGMIDKQRTN